MASLKDIMDVDVEPLESQAYNRRAAAAQQQASSSASSQPTIPPAPSLTPSVDDSKQSKTPISQAQSHRGSNPTASSSTVIQPIARRLSDVGGETMDFSGFQAGGSGQTSMLGSPQQSPSLSDPRTNLPVKYTPITGRLSRAKKGIPVHSCDQCQKTFTRAEHLRRHQLSHQKAAYPCTFEDCERVFHRPDLLARHLHRHKTQGEKPYKAEQPRSRASSSASENRTLSVKMEQPRIAISSTASSDGPQDTSGDSMAPRTAGSDTNSASSYSTITGNFQAVNSEGSTGQKRTHSQADFPESGSYPYPVSSPGRGQSNRASRPFDHQMPDQADLVDSTQQSLEDSDNPMNYTTTPHLPFLTIPENDGYPGLTYTNLNSPWCSSASSTYSTQSDGSRGPPQLPYGRGRSASAATLPDWSTPLPANIWTHGMNPTPSERNQGMVDLSLDSYETPYSSPRIDTSFSARAQLLDIPNAGDGYYMEPTVGDPTLPIYGKQVAQDLSVSTPRFSNSGTETSRGRKPGLVDTEHLSGFVLNSTPSVQSQSSLDLYLSSYWQSFHQMFPIIHQPTFDASQSILLTSAMAAIGTQYHDTTEARSMGAELNKSCKNGVELSTIWDLATMQAILLTEMFTRFRGRKATVRTWRPFEALFIRLSRDADQDRRCDAVTTSAEAPMNQFGPQPSSRVIQPNDTSEWYVWAQREARQRLLTACFMFDIHQSIYHQRPRSRASHKDIRSLICLPCPDDLWNATTPTEEWQSQRSSYLPRPLHTYEKTIMSDPEVRDNPVTRFLIVCWFASYLPPREDSRSPKVLLPGRIPLDVQNLKDVFPTSSQTNTYLALYHTPLYCLLAVSGDTWVFGQKIATPSEFQDAQKRLKDWCTSFNAAQATSHACQVLHAALKQPLPCIADGTVNHTICISDYWSLYTCALICWAFGHRFQQSSNQPMSRSDSGSDIPTPGVDEILTSEETRLKALSYTSTILEMSVEEIRSNRSVAGDTCSVINAVRDRLVLDSVGNKSGHLVDAVLVLSKIRKGIRQKWF